MSIRSKVLTACAALALLGGISAAGMIVAPAASAQVVLFTATTAVSNDGAVSYNVTGVGPPVTFGPAHTPWAIDSFTRTITVYTADSDVCVNAGIGFTAGDNCYTASVADSGGTFKTVPNAFEPNQSLTPTNNRLPSNVITGTFSGSETYVFWSDSAHPPASTNVPATLDLASNADNVTFNWWIKTLANGGSSSGQLNNDWSWKYATGCETWTDSYANNRGQSSPVSADGNVTSDSTACPAPSTTPSPVPTQSTPPPPQPAVLYGDNVNPFGNGFDVFQQHARYNQPVAGWPATQRDPATHFLREPVGTHFRFEYAPAGGGTGWCVSNPGNGALVLRACNANVWQQFDYAGGHIISVVNGGIVNPDGTGAQLTTGPSATPWGGSKYAWTSESSFPA